MANQRRTTALSHRSIGEIIRFGNELDGNRDGDLLRLFGYRARVAAVFPPGSEEVARVDALEAKLREYHELLDSELSHWHDLSRGLSKAQDGERPQ